ncbi:RNA polymerase sigma factor [Planctomycetota bacterium]
MSQERAILFVTMVGAMVKQDGFSESELDELVERARTQGEALTALYECMVDSVFRFCVVRVADKAAAEDICSEVFLNVARGIRSFRGSTYTDFRNWVFAIAANQVNGYLRKTLRRARLLQTRSDDFTPPVADGPGALETLDWPVLHEAILQLKPQHQTILTLRFFENLDYASIGAIVHLRTGAVRVTLHRILKKLRRHMLAPDVEGRNDG